MSNAPRRRRRFGIRDGGKQPKAKGVQGSAVDERGRAERSWLNRRIDGGRRVAGFSTPRHNRGDR